MNLWNISFNQRYTFVYPSVLIHLSKNCFHSFYETRAVNFDIYTHTDTNVCVYIYVCLSVSGHF